MPWPFDAVPVTIAERWPTLSTSSSTAVSVAVSEVAVVLPAATTMVASEPTVYAPSTAVTVTVVAALDGWESAADTVVVPPPSAIAASATASVTEGAASSSVIVPVPVRSLTGICAFTGPLSFTSSVSSGSSTPSPLTVTRTVLLVSPAANVSVPAGNAV